jgi:hypothetical protein
VDFVQSGIYSRHQETREEGSDWSEDLDDGISSSELVGFVVTWSDVHDRGEMTSFEQTNAITKLVIGTIGLGRETPEDVQESEDIKLSSIMNASMSKREDGPSNLQKSNVKRDIDSSKN